MDRDKQNGRRDRSLANLEELGFGPDSILMNDPKLFLDSAFLAIVKLEFSQELGEECSEQALQQIGRHHGLCDAARTLSAESRADSDLGFSSPLAGPNLAMQFSSAPHASNDFVLRGSWPEAHEARARLARIGPSDAPACSLSAGYTAGWLAEIHNAEVEVVETACRTNGQPHCEFEARVKCLEATERATRSPAKVPEPPQPETQRAETPQSTFEPSPYGHIDPEDDAVHAWGPVMVLPFIDAEIAEATLRSLEKDSFTREIRAVVVDLRGQSLETSASRAGVERILKIIDRWRAQAIFAGVSPVNEAALRVLGAECLVSLEQLPEAIAMGFQIAEAQRHAV